MAENDNRRDDYQGNNYQDGGYQDRRQEREEAHRNHQKATEQRRRRKENTEREEVGTSILTRAGQFLAADTGLAVGTALAYRTGLMPSIERGITFASRFLDRASAKMPGMDLEDWTIDEYKQFGKSVKDAFKSAKDDYYKIKLNPNDSGSMFGSLHSFLEQQENGFSRAREAEFRQRKIHEAGDWFSKNYADRNFTENETVKFHNFISDIVSNPYDRVVLHGKMRKLGFFESREKQAVAEDIIAKVQELDHQVSKEKEKGMGEWRRTIAELSQKRLDINRMERQYGTLRPGAYKQNFFQKMISKIHGENDRAVTVGEILDGTSREGKPINVESMKYSTIKNGKPIMHDPAKDLRRLNELGRRNAAKQARMKYAKEHDGAHMSDDDIRKVKEEFTKRFRQITPDAKGLRINNGRLYSTEGRRDFTEKLLSAAANTLPGKILKLRDVSYSKVAPKFFSWAEGELNPVLAAMVNGEDYNNGHLNSTIIMDDGLFYRKEANGHITNLGDLGGVYLLKGNHGTVQHMLHQMHGSIRHEESGNKFKRLFDLDQNREEYSGWGIGSTIRSFTDKFDDTKNDYYIGKIIDRMTDNSAEALRETSYARMNMKLIEENNIQIIPRYSTDYAINFLDQAEEFKNFLDENTYGFTRDTARKLSKNADGEAKKILETLGNGTNEDIENLLLEMNPEDIHNETLASLARRLRTNSIGAKDEIRQVTDRSHTSVSANISKFFSTQYSSDFLDYHDILRKELSKESILQTAYTGEDKSDVGNIIYDYRKALDSIMDNQELTKKEKSEAKRLFHFTRYEKETENIPSDINEMESDNELFNRIDVIQGITNTEDGLGQEFVDTVQKMKNEEVSIGTKYYADADKIGNAEDFSSWIVVGKGVGVKDVLRSMNSWTKFKATGGKFARQFVAGRDDMKDVTTYTFAPYFMLSRLSDEMNKVGLGFSKHNMGSTLDMAGAIALKRVIPIGVGLTYAEWLDDTSQEITGQSISGAAAQGVADVDIASRRLMDTFGLTDWLKGEKTINPIMQYWGDHGDFQNAEERRRYYKSGYTPVRSGAWWTFGGVNEARGGAIQYWEPTFARRIQSDYKDKSLYNGYFDKWSHSLLPTPSNPLSPIFGLLDPYWLEKRHKDDRPYELTGHMFEDGTPWGAILNPTIGEILKPQKDLHTIGSWLPFTDGFHYRNINGVDPKSLLHAINEEIKQKARDLGHRNYIQVNGNQLTPVDIDEFDAPTDDSTVMSVQYKHGQLVRASVGVPGKYSPRDQLSGGVDFNSSVGSRNRFGNSRSALTVSAGDSFTGGGGFGAAGGSSSHVGTSVSDGKQGREALKSINQGGMFSLRAALDYKFFGGPKPYQDNIVTTDSSGNLSVVNTKGKPADPHARSLFTEERLRIDKMINGDIGNIKEDIANLIEKFSPRKQIAMLNSKTKEDADKKKSKANSYSPNAFDADEGVLAAEKLKQFRPTDAMELLNDPDAVNDLISQGKGEGFVRNAAVSWRLVSGIYGYALGEATGFGVDDKKRIATGQDITSNSRAFWDENLGGLGGAAGEIMRRFVPDFRRGTKVNPLMNTMPDWLPDRFRYGDPFTSLPKGEMRLPGKGYESLNKLHPDQFGRHNCQTKNVRIAENSLELQLPIMYSNVA